MIITNIRPQENYILLVENESNVSGEFDVSPYLDGEAFEPLKQVENFNKVINGGYFIEWECGADLSADTIEANWKIN